MAGRAKTVSFTPHCAVHLWNRHDKIANTTSGIDEPLHKRRHAAWGRLKLRNGKSGRLAHCLGCVVIDPLVAASRIIIAA
jgi:hypothetical protein